MFLAEVEGRRKIYGTKEDLYSSALHSLLLEVFILKLS